MKVTIIVLTLEGLADDDHPPILLPGHLVMDEAIAKAREIGFGYHYCACIPLVGRSAAYYANFSNDPNPPTNADTTVERSSQGHLELWFYYGDVQA